MFTQARSCLFPTDAVSIFSFLKQLCEKQISVEGCYSVSEESDRWAGSGKQTTMEMLLTIIFEEEMCLER